MLEVRLTMGKNPLDHDREPAAKIVTTEDSKNGLRRNASGESVVERLSWRCEAGRIRVLDGLWGNTEVVNTKKWLSIGQTESVRRPVLQMSVMARPQTCGKDQFKRIPVTHL